MTRKKPTKKTGLEPKLEELAEQVLSGALDPNLPLPDKIAALRVSSAYYAMTRKLPPPEEPKENAFHGYKNALQNGSGRTSGYAGRGIPDADEAF